MYTYEFVPEHELSYVIDIIKQRISWMDEKHMKQWNDGDYLAYYSPDYFLEKIKNKEMLAMKEHDNIIAIVGFFSDDERWDHNKSYIYLHHLATLPQYHGIGKTFVKACEDIAKQMGKSGIRLDCQKGNDAIIRFYDDMGYLSKGEFTSGKYTGIRKEKLL